MSKPRVTITCFDCPRRATNGGAVEGTAWAYCDEHYLDRLVKGTLPPRVCDFCSTRAVDEGVVYTAKDFTTPGIDGTRSMGDWFACPACAELIDVGNYHVLARRSADRFLLFHAGVKRSDIEPMMIELHAAFKAHRTGGRFPLRS